LARQRVDRRVRGVEVEDTGSCFAKELSCTVPEEFVDDCCDEADSMKVLTVVVAIRRVEVNGRAA